MEYKLTFKEYNQALKKNKLMGLKCKKCSNVTCPPKMACQECGSLDLEPVQLSGKGQLISFTTQYVAPEGRENEIPYTVALAELDEGPWIMGNLIDINPNKMDMHLLGKRLTVSVRIFPGDKFSNGAVSRPVFSLED